MSDDGRLSGQFPDIGFPQGLLQPSQIRQTYPCNWQNCQAVFENLQLLYDHASTHIKNSPGKVYTCLWANCNRTLATRCSGAAHMLTHVPYRAHTCAICGRQYLKAAALKTHMQNVHKMCTKKRVEQLPAHSQLPSTMIPSMQVLYRNSLSVVENSGLPPMGIFYPTNPLQPSTFLPTTRLSDTPSPLDSEVKPNQNTEVEGSYDDSTDYEDSAGGNTDEGGESDWEIFHVSLQYDSKSDSYPLTADNLKDLCERA